MKFLAIIMSVLMFASGFDLCSEVNTCDSENKIELGQSDTQEQKSEMCTPFCHCARCAFSIIIPEKLTGNIINAFSVDSFSLSQLVLAIQASSAIWQPPKAA